MKGRPLASFGAGLLSLALAGCGTGGREAQSPGPGTRDESRSLFTVPVAQRPQLQISAVTRETWSTDVRTTGTVDWDGDHTTQAITQASGPITRIVADLGSRVKAGDPLLYVASPDLAAALSTYRKAWNRLDLARRTLDRNRDLLDHHAIAERDLESSQADYNDAQTEAQNDRETLRILGMTDAQVADAQRQDGGIRPEFAVRSPIAGVVVQKLVLPGQLVQAGVTQCFVVSDTGTVWVQAHLYESDLASVRPADPAQVTAAVAPGAFEGRIAYVGAMIDPATRTTPVRIVTGNPHGLLKKDEFVDVVIHGVTRREVLTVPASAVLYNGNNFPFVYFQVEPGKFAERLVTLGTERGDRIAVVSGLNEGDLVVARGSVFLQFAEMYQR